jgi:hypothetical protein
MNTLKRFTQFAVTLPNVITENSELKSSGSNVFFSYPDLTRLTSPYFWSTSKIGWLRTSGFSQKSDRTPAEIMEN